MVGRGSWKLLIALFLAFSVGCASDDPANFENQDPEENKNQGEEKDEAELEVTADDPMTWTLGLEESATGSFDIANVGEEELDFDISADGDWLQFSPATGEVDGGESTTVEVEVSCGDEADEYAATITVDSNGGTHEFGAQLNCEAPAPGELTVTIEGLPSGLNADVTVEGPEGFSELVTGTTTFEEVAVGEYQVTASQVGDEAVYVPDPNQITLEVESERESSVTIEYDAVPGGVLVSVDGLPGHLEASLTLVRGSDEWDVPDNGLVQNLEPGSYTVVSDPVVDGDDTWEASDTAVTVKSSEIAEVTVTFLVDVGYLEITVQDLPDGTDHEIFVIAQSDGTTTEVPQTGSLTLEPGSYDVEAHDVEVGLATYEASGDTTVEIVEGETETVTISYELIDAEVEVTIRGLDDVSSSASVAIEFIGDEEQKTVTDSGTITLFPDTYSVEPANVNDGLATYIADSKTVDLESGTNPELFIDYDLQYAELTIDLAGDLDEGQANIEVTSTDGFSESHQGSTVLDELVPGEYTVTVHDVTLGDATYEGSGSDSFVLGSNDTETVTASYELIRVDVIVSIEEYGDVDYEFELTGPDGFEETITSSTSFAGELPGTYELSLVNATDDGFGNDPYIDYDSGAVTVTSADGEHEFEVVARAANIVTTEDDDASARGTLRYVLENVGSGTEIVFAGNVSQIELSQGQLAVDKEVAIIGNGSNAIVLDGAEQTRLFDVVGSGELSLFDLELTRGYAEGSTINSGGGAVRVADDGVVHATRVLFRGNWAESSGGAVHVGGDAYFEAEDSLFRDNEAGVWGAAVQTAGSGGDLNHVYLRRSLFQDNQAFGGGGAIDGFASNGQIDIEQSTFVGNISGGLAAAIVIFSGDATIEGVTVSGNFNDNVNNDEVGGLFVGYGTHVTLRGNIIAGNAEQDMGGYASPIHSTGYNVIGDASAVSGDIDWHSTDQSGVANPGLQSLTDNGGPTATMRLSGSSPARSIIPVEECQDAELDWSQDQRGYHRPAGAFCSAGAYEAEGGLETFENADMSASQYETGSFTGDDGVEWSYVETMRSGSGSGSIDGTSVVLRDSPTGSIKSDQISGSISSLSMQLGHGFTGNGDRQVEVFVNGTSVGTSEPFDDGDQDGISGGAPVRYFAVDGLNISGGFDIEIVNIGDGQILVDNVSWQ